MRPINEHSTSTIVVAVALLYASTLALYFLFCGTRPEPIIFIGIACGVWISVTEFRSRTIPDGASIALVASVILLGGYDVHDLLPRFISSSMILVALWSLSEIFYRVRHVEGLGLGDVKLIAAITFVAGISALPQIILLASIGGIVYALTKRTGRSECASQVPFGPFLMYALFLVHAFEAGCGVRSF